MSLFIFTGAGISAASGLATFRDSNGLWHNHNPDKVCCIHNFKNNYDETHDFYNKRRVESQAAKPNEAHLLIAKMQREFNARVITTNVDDLLTKAGCKNVLHLHGEIGKMVNQKTGKVFDVEGCFKHENKEKIFKPGVIFFGEIAPNYFELASIADFDIRNNDVVIFIGMSFQVVDWKKCLPASYIPRSNIKVFNINTDPSVNINYEGAENLTCKAEVGLAKLYDVLPKIITQNTPSFSLFS